MVYAGLPGKPSTQTGFGALTYSTSHERDCLGSGLAAIVPREWLRYRRVSNFEGTRDVRWFAI